MRAAARQAQLRISAQAGAESCGAEDEDHHDLPEAPDALSSDSHEDDEDDVYDALDDSDQDSDDDQDEYDDHHPYTIRDDSFSRRSNTPQTLPARTSTRLPLRVAPANYNYRNRNYRLTSTRLPVRARPMSVRQNNGIPRQNMRDAIVQQWDPSRRPNPQSRPAQPTGAPPTPPLPRVRFGATKRPNIASSTTVPPARSAWWHATQPSRASAR